MAGRGIILGMQDTLYVDSNIMTDGNELCSFKRRRIPTK